MGKHIVPGHITYDYTPAHNYVTTFWPLFINGDKITYSLLMLMSLSNLAPVGKNKKKYLNQNDASMSN